MPPTGLGRKKRFSNPVAALSSRRGASALEYGLLMSAIAVTSISALVAVSERVDFQYLVAALNAREIHSGLDNYLDNGDFDEIAGMTATGYGYYESDPILGGWESLDGENFELHRSGHMGMPSVNGGYWLDMGASPGNLDLRQSVDGLIDGAVYKITLYAGDRRAALDSRVEVRWNGEWVGTITPAIEDEMAPYTFNIRAGAGDGTDTVRVTETGPNDAYGMSLDQVRIFGR